MKQKQKGIGFESQQFNQMKTNSGSQLNLLMSTVTFAVMIPAGFSAVQVYTPRSEDVAFSIMNDTSLSMIFMRRSSAAGKSFPKLNCQ